MTILTEILGWSKTLAAWQQDAIARLYANRTLTHSDFEALYILAKVEAGIADTAGRTPKLLLDAEIPAASDSKRLVQILSIKELANVNVLVSGGTLPIAPSGLTVVYGENGSGKSGYSRVFKHACRARDQRESILPDANLDPADTGIAKATFETLIDGVHLDLPWAYDATPPEPLSDISIFDTHCARAYIDNHGDFAYVPYGLDILEGLVAVCVKLRAMAALEISANTPSDAAYSALARERTKVADALNNIPAITRPEDIEALALLSDTEIGQLGLLERTLAEPDPIQKAKALRQKALRLEGLKERIIASVAQVTDEKLLAFRALIDKSNVASKAAELASTEFKQTPGQLFGTGGEEWKALFRAAREFAKISHPEHEFPNLSDRSVCPLCQNPLGADGSRRLVRFDSFVRQTVEKVASEAQAAVASAQNEIQRADLELRIDDALRAELTELNPALADDCVAMQRDLNARKKFVLLAVEGKGRWEDVPNIPADPRRTLDLSVSVLRDEASSLEATADETGKSAMIASFAELNARRRLGEVKVAVLEAIGKHDYCRKLQKCIDGMDTRGISRKSTDLSRTMASQELANALNEELQRLKVHELRVVMKPESPGGRTQFKLTLQMPGGASPAAILSEGEQRAVAIASFFAEIKLGNGRGGVVFDDPVSSLDHRRRWEVAERMALESLARQVIIFTHDIYFLCILEQKAEEAGASLTKVYIRRTPDGFGVPSNELPFDVLGAKDRIGRLRSLLVEVRKAKKIGDDDGHRKLTADAYGELRLAWERCIEEVLFNQVVQRFGEGVMTQRLKQVVVTDADYREIDGGMTKSSKFEHDAAMRVGRLPIPDPDELSQDIEKLAAWRLAVLARQTQVASNRK